MLGKMFGGLLLWSGYKGIMRKRAWTPELQSRYEETLNNGPKQANLNLAVELEEKGFPDKAEILRKRAAIRDLAPEVQETRGKVYRRAMRSKKPASVEAVADAFAGEGCVGAAATLRKYAEGLRAVDPDVMLQIADTLERSAPKSMTSKTAARMLRERAQNIDNAPAQKTEEELQEEPEVVEAEAEVVEQS